MRRYKFRIYHKLHNFKTFRPGGITGTVAWHVTALFEPFRSTKLHGLSHQDWP